MAAGPSDTTHEKCTSQTGTTFANENTSRSEWICSKFNTAICHSRGGRTFAWSVVCVEVKGSRVSPNGLSVLSRMDSDSKGVSGVVFGVIPITSPTPVCQYGQIRSHDISSRLHQYCLAHFPAQCIIVTARAQDKHSRVADGICALIWNMREQTAPFST